MGGKGREIKLCPRRRFNRLDVRDFGA